jgi:hypothetical protein
MREKEMTAEIFRLYPAVRYEHAAGCAAASACDCETPGGFHTSKCASLRECECNGKLRGIRFKR